MRKISCSIDNQWLARLLILTALLSSLPLTIYARVVTPKLDEAVKAKISKSYLSLPLRFEANQGQTDSQVRFLARGGNYTLFLTPAEVVLTLTKTDPETSAEKHQPLRKTKIISKKVTGTSVRIKLDGSNPDTKVLGLEEQHGKSHYFQGNDPKRWLASVANYAKVKYEAIYPGIDLIFYGNERQLEYDFLVSPGAKPDVIDLNVEGCSKLELDDSGDLLIHTSGGQLHLRRPFVYQEIEGIKNVIAGYYVIRDTNKVGFELAMYDTSKPIVIDPVLSYSTYLGGAGDDYVEGITVDPSGYVYMAGHTTSLNFHSQNPPQTNTGRGVFKSLNSGSTWNGVNKGLDQTNVLAIAIDPLTPSTLYAGTRDGLFKSTDGGANWSLANTGLTDPTITALAIDPVNPTTVYAGTTGAGVFKSTNGGQSWSPISTGLTSGPIYALAVDPATPAKVFAGLGAPDYGFTGGLFRSTDGGENWALVLEAMTVNMGIIAIVIDPSTPTTVYAVNGFGVAWGYNFYRSTDGGANFSGVDPGALDDVGFSALAIDPASSTTLYAGMGVHLCKSINWGANWGAKFEVGAPISALGIDPKTPTTLYAATHGKGLFKTTDGGQKWSPANTGLTGQRVSAIAIDSLTPSRLYAGADGGGLYDVFVIKLSPTDFSPVYLTYVGGSDEEQGRGIAADSEGNAYVCGYTASKDFPVTEGAFQTSGVPGDAFVFKLNPEGSGFLYSTYLGGSGGDDASGIAVDSQGNAYVTGSTSSSDFPVTEGAFDTTLKGVFVTKLNADGSSLVYSTYLGGTDGLFGASSSGIAVDGSGSACVTGATYATDFPTTPGAYRPHKSEYSTIGESEAYLTKLNPEGSALVYSTYLGADWFFDATGSGVVFDLQGNAYVTGNGHLGATNVFLYKLTADGSIQPYGENGFFRSYGDEFAEGIAVDGSGNIFITGYSGGAFLWEIDANGVLSTFLLDEEAAGHAIAADLLGNVYVAGFTPSTDFPITADALQSSFGGGYCDSFVMKISPDPPPPPPLSADEGTIGNQFTITGSNFGTKKGKVLINGIPAKIAKDGWSPTLIACTINKPPLPAEVAHTVAVEVNRVSIPIDGTFTLKYPSLDDLLDSSGAYPVPIRLTGKFFGTKKGKVYLYDPGSKKKKNLKLTDWKMVESTGVSELTFLVPKPSKSFPSGSYQLKVSNKIGTATASTNFTLEPLPLR